MRLFFCLFLCCGCFCDLYADLKTSTPHPVFSPPDAVTLKISADCTPDAIVSPDAVVAMFSQYFRTEITNRFAGTAFSPVIIVQQTDQYDTGMVITIVLKGYAVTLSSCSMYIEYTINDSLYTYTDMIVYSTPIDTGKLHGTYAQKKTAACEQAVALFIKQFLDTFFTK